MLESASGAVAPSAGQSPTAFTPAVALPRYESARPPLRTAAAAAGEPGVMGLASRVRVTPALVSL
jgi:hypothetical protein